MTVQMAVKFKKMKRFEEIVILIQTMVFEQRTDVYLANLYSAYLLWHNRCVNTGAHKVDLLTTVCVRIAGNLLQVNSDIYLLSCANICPSIRDMLYDSDSTYAVSIPRCHLKT